MTRTTRTKAWFAYLRHQYHEALWTRQWEREENEKSFRPIRDRMAALAEVLWWRWTNLNCRVRGHQFEPDGHDYPQDGGEGFTCRRCGYGFTAWH